MCTYVEDIKAVRDEDAKLQINRAPISVDNDNARYEVQEACQKYNKDNDTKKILFFLLELQ